MRSLLNRAKNMRRAKRPPNAGAKPTRYEEQPPHPALEAREAVTKPPPGWWCGRWDIHGETHVHERREWRFANISQLKPNAGMLGKTPSTMPTQDAASFSQESSDVLNTSEEVVADDLFHGVYECVSGGGAGKFSKAAIPTRYFDGEDKGLEGALPHHGLSAASQYKMTLPVMEGIKRSVERHLGFIAPMATDAQDASETDPLEREAASLKGRTLRPPTVVPEGAAPWQLAKGSTAPPASSASEATDRLTPADRGSTAPAEDRQDLHETDPAERYAHAVYQSRYSQQITHSLPTRMWVWAVNKYDAELRNQSLQGWRNFLWNDQARFIDESLQALAHLLDAMPKVDTEHSLAMVVRNWMIAAKSDWDNYFRPAFSEELAEQWRSFKFTDFEEWLNKAWIEFKVALFVVASVFIALWLQKRKVDAELARNNIRSIRSFFEQEGVFQAAEALQDSENVMIVTGFCVDKGMPETDGPPGAAAIAWAYYCIGSHVTIVTDSANEVVVRDCLRAIDPDMAAHVKLIVRNLQHDMSGYAEAVRMLDDLHPDAVISVELPGPNQDGDVLNMRGVSVKDFNSALYQLTLAARDTGITTMGIGDGGNETGSSNEADLGKNSTKHVPLAQNGLSMRCEVPSDYPVTAWNSNLGGFAFSAAMLRLHRLEDKFLDEQDVLGMIMASLEAGAVDGVTRKSEVGAPSDTDSRFVTGVDGYPPEQHMHDIRELNQLFRMADLHERKLITSSGGHTSPAVAFQTIDRWNAIIATPHRWILKYVTKTTIDEVYGRLRGDSGEPATAERPKLRVAMGDSSHGGLVGGSNYLIEALKSKYPQYDLEFIFVLDHANAPYGRFSPEELRKLDNRMVLTAQDLGADIFLMVCNTASTVLDSPEALEGVNIPVVNLVTETSKGIVQSGGEHPVIVSTQATAESPAYTDKVAEMSQGSIQLRARDRIGAPRWAPAINETMHLDPTKAALVDEMVQEIIDKVPKDATSVWLCCTHYPALYPWIRKRLDQLGMGHVKLIDPMEYLAEGAFKKIDRLPKMVAARRAGLPSGQGKHSDDVDVFSSGKVDVVNDSAAALIEPKVNPRRLRFYNDMVFGRHHLDPASVRHFLEGKRYDPAALSKDRAPVHAMLPMSDAQVEVFNNNAVAAGRSADLTAWRPTDPFDDAVAPWGEPLALYEVHNDLMAGRSLQEIADRRLYAIEWLQSLSSEKIKQGHDLHQARLAREQAAIDSVYSPRERAGMLEARATHAAARNRRLRDSIGAPANMVPLADPSSPEQLEQEYEALTLIHQPRIK